MKWRLGIDLGSNSLGWAALELTQNGSDLKPTGLVDCGSRIFSDGRNPKDKQSNAAKRRVPRGARKNRDRYKRRRTRLMRQLIEFGLMPQDEAERKQLEGGKDVDLAESDPWILRSRALDERITPFQLGRALFHLHQRRGFKSNRKTDSGDSDSGKVHDATQRTKEKLKDEGARTLGELFGRPRHQALQHNEKVAKGERKSQPLARVRKSGKGAKWQYDYYPTRALILDEFDQLWTAQSVHYPDLLTAEARDALRDTIEWQHPLKPQPVGKCTLMPEYERAPKALPSSQRIRIFQEVNALRVGAAGKAKEPLSLEERDQVTARLLHPTNKSGEVSFDQLRKLLRLSKYDNFNTESEKRKKLQGDETAARLMLKDRWGTSWFELDLAQQDEIVLKLVDEQDTDKLVAWLIDQHGLDSEQARRVADCNLPDGHGNLSKQAIDKVLPELEKDVITYDKAVVNAGFDSHSQFGTGEIFHTGLPYYGQMLERSVAFGSGDPEDPDEKRFGKVANPTVHVALNQIRAVVNDLIKRFGAPEQIVLELSRDLPLSAKGKGELEANQKKNQEDNESRRATLRERGVHDSYENRMRLRLYEEMDALGKRCVFSGDHIGLNDLFTDNIEIEHILPFSRTLDDSFGNKVLATRRANRDKQNRTPHEAFGHSPGGYSWEEISKRANELPNNKRWRFDPDAMNRYESEERDFLARQLTDNQYISRLAKTYVEGIYGGQGYKGSTNQVWVITGRLTHDLRWQWGLDSILQGGNVDMAEAQKKNRHDHRHHAIDAVVIGCTDRGMLKRAADEAQRYELEESSRLLAGIPDPWPGFRDDVDNVVKKVVVSHKPDHGFQDAMHNDTAYGIAKGEDGEPDKSGVRTVATRKPLDSDAFKAPKDLEKIRDTHIRSILLAATEGKKGTEFKEALLATAQAQQPPVYKVRTEERLKVIPIEDSDGKVFKAYKGDGNYCYDIWVNEKGKWTGEVISTFDAYQLSQTDRNWWQVMTGRCGQPLVMRLRKKDYLRVEDGGRTMIVQVVGLSPGMITLAEHFEANVDARNRSKDDVFTYKWKAPSALQKVNAIKVTVSPSGKVSIYN